jgi:hypothetical protein
MLLAKIPQDQALQGRNFVGQSISQGVTLRYLMYPFQGLCNRHLKSCGGKHKHLQSEKRLANPASLHLFWARQGGCFLFGYFSTFTDQTY